MKRIIVLALGCLVLGLGSADAQVPNKKDIPKFIKDLTAKDAKARLAAVEGIAAIGEVKAVYAKDAVAPLAEALVKDDDAKVRAAAAAALVRIDADPTKAVPALIDRLKNEKDTGALQASMTSIGYYGKNAKDALPLLKDYADKARAEANAAGEELKKARDAGDKEKEKVAQGKQRAAQQMAQTAGTAMRSISDDK